MNGVVIHTIPFQKSYLVNLQLSFPKFLKMTYPLQQYENHFICQLLLLCTLHYMRIENNWLVWNSFTMEFQVYVIGEDGILKELELAGFQYLGGPVYLYSISLAVICYTLPYLKSDILNSLSACLVYWNTRMRIFLIPRLFYIHVSWNKISALDFWCLDNS